MYLKFINHNNKIKTKKLTFYLSDNNYLFIKNKSTKEDISMSLYINLIIDTIRKNGGIKHDII